MHSINIWKQLPLLSDPIIQPTSLASVLSVYFSALHIHSANPAVPSVRAVMGGEECLFDVSIWCAYSNVPSVHRCLWNDLAVTGPGSLLVPISNLIKENIEIKLLFLFSHFSGQLCQVVILVPWIVCIKNKEIKWWLVLKSIGWNDICLQCELSYAQTDVQQGFQVDRGHIRISTELFFKYTYLGCISSTSMTSSDSGYS